MQGRTNCVGTYREDKEDNGLKVPIGYIVVDDLAESSFSRGIGEEVRLQWIEGRVGSKAAEKQTICFFKEKAVAERCHGA